MKRIPINPGDRFERLVLIEELSPIKYPSGQSKRFGKFKCDCGQEVKETLDNVRRGKSKSCGCLSIDKHTTHDLSREPLAAIWYGMHRRCQLDPNYFNRHITVCKEWSGSEGLPNFLDWVKAKGNYQPGLEIDRKDNDKGYESSNCRFVNRTVNQRNKTNALLVEHPRTGEKISLITLWEQEGNPDLKWVTVRARYLYCHWPVLDSINKPSRQQ